MCATSKDVCALHTDYKGVLWELLEEAFLGGSVDVEVQCLRVAGQECQAKAQY